MDLDKTTKRWWFRKEVRFSDWRNVPSVDYSTNALVTQWYSGKPTKYFRQEEIQGFVNRLNSGDTLTLGIDYYAIFPVSKIWLDKLNPKIFYDVYSNIETEKSWSVVVIKVWWNGKINYQRIY